LNFLDLLMIVIFFGVFALGFFAGIWRCLSGLVSLAVGLVATSFFYQPVGDILVGRFSSIDARMGDLIGFLSVLVITSFLVNYLVLRSFRTGRLRTRLTFETHGGLPWMMLLTVLSISLAIVVVAVLVQVFDWTVREMPPERLTVWAANQYADSALSDHALRLSPYIYDAVNEVTPGTVPVILQPRA
jgi:hypothetical protein